MLAEKLLGKVYDLRIYDRSVQAATLTGVDRAYIDREIPPPERLMVRRRAVGRQGGDRRACRAGRSGAPDCWACRAWGARSGRVFRTAASRWDCLEGLCWYQPSRGRRDVAGHPFRAAIRRPAPSFASALKSATASPSRKPAAAIGGSTSRRRRLAIQAGDRRCASIAHRPDRGNRSCHRIHCPEPDAGISHRG
jgi:hypothetical protein